MTTIIIIIVAICLIIAFIYFYTSSQRVLNAFKDGNVIVYGKRGKGKDVLFHYATLHDKRKYHLSNIKYNDYSIIKDIKVYDIRPNTYETFIDNNYQIIKPNKVFNKYYSIDYFFSDAGIYFPSQLDSILHKKYPYLPIVYALSRQLWLSNIHCNSQSLDRIWKPLREQADSYIKCLGCIKIFGLMFLSYRFYDKYSTALQDVRPFKPVGINNEFSKAQVAIEQARYGIIKEGCIIMFTKNIKYDSRAFYELIFGKKAPKNIKDFVFNYYK